MEHTGICGGINLYLKNKDRVVTSLAFWALSKTRKSFNILKLANKTEHVFYRSPRGCFLIE